MRLIASRQTTHKVLSLSDYWVKVGNRPSKISVRCWVWSQIPGEKPGYHRCFVELPNRGYIYQGEDIEIYKVKNYTVGLTLPNNVGIRRITLAKSVKVPKKKA